ncbi:MAG: cytochrome c biogenesis protein CcdA [Actinobacteria bacterium]|nr:cytochrome c biogenesis protein CcdA [Actinomycetota bacterium]
MFDGPYALAIAAGMAATVNPCGFALLPAYLSAFLGIEHRAGGANAVARALAVSGALTAGFVVVFGAFGLIITPLALSIEDKLPWVTVVIGVGLVALGIALLAGRQPTLKIPKLQRGGSDGTLPSMFLFGISYATASLSCTIGPFLAITTTTFRSSSFVAGSAVFLAYALGMGIVIGVLTVALSLARATVVQRFRNALPKINRFAGGLIVIAGVYVAYYGWYEIRVLNGNTDDPIIDRAIRIQSWLTNHIIPDDPAQTALIAVVVLTAAAVAAAVFRRRTTSARISTREFSPEEPSNEPPLLV